MLTVELEAVLVADKLSTPKVLTCNFAVAPPLGKVVWLAAIYLAKDPLLDRNIAEGVPYLLASLQYLFVHNLFQTAIRKSGLLFLVQKVTGVHSQRRSVV